MSNIVQFPKSSKLKGLDTKIESLIKKLDARNDEVRKHTAAIAKLEKEFCKVEVELEEAVRELADRVGAESVPLKYWDYSKSGRFAAK